MLTHHLQDSNLDAAQLIKSGVVRLDALTGRFQKVFDNDDGSFSSERHKQAKIDKIEQEFSRLMERNNG